MPMQRTLLKSKIHRAINEDLLDDGQIAGSALKLVFVNPDNRIKDERSTVPVKQP